MLPSLGIRNYRNLKSLDIERLARVNLIAGKNNTGKTSLLEAVSLYAAGGDISRINQILFDRDEVVIQDHNQRSLTGRLVHPDSYLSLFCDRQTVLDSGYQGIAIKELNSDSSEQKAGAENRVLIRMVRFARERSEDGKTVRTILFGEGDLHKYVDDINLGLEIEVNGETKLHALDRIRNSLYRSDRDLDSFSFQFVKTRDTDSDFNGALWDKIALTEYEDYVAEALRIVDSSVDRVAFISNGVTHKRKPVVKLEGQKIVLPLQSMGDGMNRILTIILALVNAQDGYLLIDEFENGLHHTVQEDLWKMIFKLAKELNVQVFATTHSDDCIHAFANILNCDENQSEGQYFRLEKFGDIVKPIFYSPSALEVAADQNIETR